MIPGKKLVLPALAAFLIVGCAPEQGDEATEAEQAPAAPPDSTPTVVFETSMGRIVMELDQRAAPATVTNFVRHVNQQFYRGLIIHRVWAPVMIQMGRLTSNYERRVSPAAFLQNEGDNGLLNVRGAVSMARGSDPHSATTEIFINAKDNPQLDTNEETWGYCVFGRVIEGMDVVDVIVEVPVRDRGTRDNVPVDEIVIDTAYVAVDESEWAETAEGEEGSGGA